MRHIVLFVLAISVSLTHAQLPVIDYDFLAVPPDIRVNKVVVQPDGKILIGGAFTNYAGTGTNNLVRLNADGTVDTEFNPGGSGPQHVVHDIALMDDGRIIIAGAFPSYNGQQCSFVLRLNANGIRDYSFTIPPNSINNAVNAVAIHDDDKVVAAGDFFVCYGNSQPYIVRFNYDGSLDTTFNIGSGFNAPVYDLLVIDGSRILCAGNFGTYNGNTAGRVALLSPDGPLDPSMAVAPGFGGGAAQVLEQQPDGKILVGGWFTHHNGQSTGGLARLFLSGERDMGFTNPLYLYGSVQALAVQDDGRILAGGEFTSTMYDPNVPGPGRLMRMQADGTRDDSFPIGTGMEAGGGVTAFVCDIALQPDGKALVGGRFGGLDSEDLYQQLIRLHTDMSTGIAEAGEAVSFPAYWDLGSGNLHVGDPFGNGALAQLQIYSLSGSLVKGTTVIPGNAVHVPGSHSPGIYLLVLEQDGRRVTQRVLAR